jgi:hypothetical protein
VQLLEDLEDADVSDAAGAAAGKNQDELGTRFGAGGGLVGGHGSWAGEGDEEGDCGVGKLVFHGNDYTGATECPK